MKYKATFKLTNPKTKEFTRVESIFDIYGSPFFEYGNGKAMNVDFSRSRAAMGEDQMFDIRYDTRYRSDDEPAYIKRFIAEQWTGTNGSWRATYITVHKTI